ncbi:family 20 glycosylhydrolase [Actinoplanes sp. NPDC051494]|uniref:family 20 glycosylhydrolase n=1 Tax=Actinoplanes sp. NPDC051494 TaxID=3363907 RepID=UPI003787B392
MSAPARAAPAPPATIPSIQRWTAASGTYTFTAASRIVTSTAALRTAAGLLAADLRTVTGYPVPIASGTPAGGDVVLTTGGFGNEGYRLTLAGTATISGSTAGVFYGTQTLLQMLKQNRSLPRGTATDAPVYRDRGFMIDTGRKFYTIDWLRARIRELAYLKYNRLNLHLSDDQEFRIESSSHPEVVSATHYTKAQIAGLVAYAAQYQITIVPEIDMPGHMTRILRDKPGLSLVRDNGTRSLDLSSDQAWPLARDLITEYLPLFTGPYWHLGADEWLSTAELSRFPQLNRRARQLFGNSATGRDLQYDFINKINDLVRANGRTLRIWNDQLVPGTVVDVAPTVQIAHWYGSTDMTPRTLADRGHDLINANWNQLYYIIGITRPDPAAIYESFAPNQFASGTGHTTIARSDPHLLGSQLSLWGEPGRDEPENDIATNLKDPLRALIQGTWGSPKPTSAYTTYTAIIRAVGDAPTGGTVPAEVRASGTSTITVRTSKTVRRTFTFTRSTNGTPMASAQFSVRVTVPGGRTVHQAHTADSKGRITVPVTASTRAGTGTIVISYGGSSRVEAATFTVPVTVTR